MKLLSGATIAALILSSDKTQLTQFQGDKKAWPVYLTIGNISKKICCQPSTHATILVGYLPVAKLDCFSKGIRSLQGYRLFHHCMAMIFGSLEQAGREGVEMVCACYVSTCCTYQILFLLQLLYLERDSFTH